MSDWNLEKQRFLAAVVFYTRLPVSGFHLKSADHTGDLQPTRYFPLIGVLIGLLSALTFVSAQPFFSKQLSVLFGLALAVWVSGALHEDGLADSADAFGAGWNPEEIRRILKDSRLGVYGVLSLVVVFLIKYQSLLEIDAVYLPLVWIAGHAFSRFAAISLLLLLNYVGDSGSKSSSMVSLNKMGWAVAALCGMLPLLGLGRASIPAFFACLLFFWVLWRFFEKRLGGVTGDCMGAAQQLTETLFYLAMALSLKY